MDENGHPPLRVKLLREGAQPPSRGSSGAVGYDLRLLPPPGQDGMTLRRGEVLACPTGVAVAVEPGWYGRVAPRSGLGRKGIQVMGGVVDPDYRGEVLVMLSLVGGDELRLDRGERIAQLVLERCATPDVVVVDDLGETERGANGFGSTGRL